jgi:hypothetical protein
MEHNDQRITLIARESSKPDIDWDYPHSRAANVTFLNSLNAVKFAIRSGRNQVRLNIERVIVDRAGSAEDFLELLAVVPPELLGDLLFIRDDGSGFLSATGRGGDRLLYALSRQDVRFYLETHGLVTGRIPLSLSA